MGGHVDLVDGHTDLMGGHVDLLGDTQIRWVDVQV